MFRFLLPSVAAGPIFLTPNDRLVKSDGAWHDSKADEIPFQAGCGIRPEEFYNQVIPGAKKLSFCDRSTADYSEVAPLTQFFNAMGGPNWRDNSGWLTGHPCFNFWTGIECNTFGKVTKIMLPDNKVRGVIPASIAQLTSLREIHLNNIAHNFHDRINENLNIVTGAIPDLSALSHLQVLELNFNEVQSLPDFRSNLELEILSVSKNKLTTFPLVQDLKKLRILQLNDNFIQAEFPGDVVCSLSNIKYLNIGGNKFTGSFPSCLTDLNPVVFDVSNRQGDYRGMQGEFPEGIIEKWTDIATGYLSLYYHFTLRGRIATACQDSQLCYRYMYATHGDLTWAQSADQVPSIVFETIDKAARR